jgi:hypothetical protein
MIEHLKKLSPETIAAYLETRDDKALGIHPKLGEYILQIDAATRLYKKHRVISECARHLQQAYPNLSIHTCKSRIYDSINYLYEVCTVTESSWLLYYADMYMRLFEVNLVGHNLKEARVCLKYSLDCRIRASDGAVDSDRTRFKPQIVSPDITVDRMRIEKKGLLDSYREALKIIGSLDANDVEVKRLIKEVESEFNIIDTEHEEIK